MLALYELGFDLTETQDTEIRRRLGFYLPQNCPFDLDLISHRWVRALLLYI